VHVANRIFLATRVARTELRHGDDDASMAAGIVVVWSQIPVESYRADVDVLYVDDLSNRCPVLEKVFLEDRLGALSK
jgi:hypothetical protein